jgi:glycosyltransferase involved in cell wall biosynthesis
MDKLQAGLVGAAGTADMHAPLVTIVILNHNYAEFVGRCIQSVDQQDYGNIQCIVLECGSNDDSLSVIEAALAEAKRPFFQMLRRDENRGQVMNYLSALDEIQGAFVSFLDADDFLFPGFVSTHIKAHLNDLHSAALSVTDQIQMDAAGQVLAGTCQWHQKSSALVTGWTDLTHARSWAPSSPYRMKELDISHLHYVPAWWSSWVMERWIWSAMSGLMFRKSVIDSLVPPMELSEDLRDLSMDTYFARFAHSVGGTLVIDSAQGGYRRHGKNKHSNNQILGGQTPSGTRDQLVRFSKCQRVARHALVTRRQQLLRLLGGELYYSVAWQLMPNQDFFDFVKGHEKDRAIWEKTIKAAGATHPDMTTREPKQKAGPSGPLASPTGAPVGNLSLMYKVLKSGIGQIVRRAVPARSAEALAKSLYATLSEAQRSEICFEWNHHDKERGLFRRFTANHWQVTRPVITSDFFTAEQQLLVGQIFRSLLDPAWHDSFMRQLADDTDRHPWGKDQSIAFFGDPRSGPWQFVLTGRHLTLRVGSPQSQVFGGPIVYGHAASGYQEKAGHPGNIFWPQAEATSRLYAMLDEPQRKVAEIEALPEEHAIGFDTAPLGISARELSPRQKAELNLVLHSLAAPFRASDRARIASCLAAQGGLEALHVAFARANRISAPDWDNWRLQGPSFVWHWRGWPHVHVWVNIGDDPAEPVNARSGVFIFPEHDPLRF